MNIIDAINALKPGAIWVLQGDTYAGLDWSNETTQTKPTEAEITTWITANSYKSQRKKEYPPLADLADAIYWNEKGDPTKLAAYTAACDQVKLDYPKP